MFVQSLETFKHAFTAYTDILASMYCQMVIISHYGLSGTQVSRDTSRYSNNGLSDNREAKKNKK